MKILIRFTFILISFVFPFLAYARDSNTIADWYVKDFQSTITVNSDSSLLIEEKITADAGNLPDKHGIFRVVPTETKTDGGIIKTPVSLTSITDLDGIEIPYSASTDNFNHTITWKIGSADRTVTGVNYYKITYLVKNAIRGGNADFDELYWNLLGNFWDIEIDNFNVKIVFPAGISQTNSKVYLYSGALGQKGNYLADYQWGSDGALQVNSNQTIPTQQGISASITFPKNIIKPYQPGFFELYGDYLWFLIPLVALIFSYLIWLKYGKDPAINKTIIPEFEIPENLTPMEMGLLYKNGSFKDSLISATIVDLAVKKYITIEEVPKTGMFGKLDFRLKRIWGSGFPALNNTENLLLEKIFGSKQEILISGLKDNFYKDLPEIRKSAIESLKTKELIQGSGLTLKTIFLVFGFIALFGISFIALATNIWLAVAISLSGTILVFFGLLMPKRTPKGAGLNWRVKGFKLYMETAEKYRSQFNEKENIFEKYLPYAMVFGIAKLWAKKMEDIYGKEYFASYHPIWFVGNFSGNFDADNFTSQMNSISASISSNIGTTSGSSGSGFSGGGGGGGGGGGW